MSYKNIDLTQISRDPEGYLKEVNDWNELVAQSIALEEDIELSDEHWQVIHYIRDFYFEFQTSPSIRPLVKYLAKMLPEGKGNSLYLQVLFPDGPAKQATKIAGLPKPARCT